MFRSASAEFGVAPFLIILFITSQRAGKHYYCGKTPCPRKSRKHIKPSYPSSLGFFLSLSLIPLLEITMSNTANKFNSEIGISETKDRQKLSQLRTHFEALKTIQSMHQFNATLSDNFSASISIYDYADLGTTNDQASKEHKTINELEQNALTPVEKVPPIALNIFGLKPVLAQLKEISESVTVNGKTETIPHDQSDHDYTLHEVLGEGGMGRDRCHRGMVWCFLSQT